MGVSHWYYLVDWQEFTARYQVAKDEKFISAAIDDGEPWIKDAEVSATLESNNAACQVGDAFDAFADEITVKRRKSLEHMLVSFGTIPGVAPNDILPKNKDTYLTISMSPATIASILSSWLLLDVEDLRQPFENLGLGQPDTWISSFDDFKNYLTELGKFLQHANNKSLGAFITIA